MSDGASSAAPMLWTPSAERRAQARVTHFTQHASARHQLSLENYEALWRWSTEEITSFWATVWEYFDVPAHVPYTAVLEGDRMPGAKWFTGSRLNFVDQVFRHRALETPALIYRSEAAGRGTVSWGELERAVGALAATLRRLGVQKGDRVAAFLPNIPQTVVAFLACASVGAIWSVCAPELGVTSVVDRYTQIEPKVLIACDGYRFAGKVFDRRANVEAMVSRLPSVQHLILVQHLDPDAALPALATTCEGMTWAEATREAVPLQPVALPFDHPLWIVYSSGTTGLPKGIVHGHGGVLLNGLVSAALQSDLREGDRYFWIASTSWAIWNAHLFGLLAGATLLLFDGSPSGAGPAPDWGTVWRFVAEEKITNFGAGAAFHASCLKAGVLPKECGDLSALVTLNATGSPLSPEAYRWIYTSVKSDLWLNCAAGGTDIAAAFVAGVPTLPVYEGEMQCRCLGAAVHAFNDEGKPVMDEVGELVCTQPLPSMPLFFWNDPDGKRYWDSYFDMFKGSRGEPVWRHGDWLRLVPRPDATGAVIYGRSDSTLKRNGVRIGTAELYNVVEALDEVADSLVVDLEYLGGSPTMLLFVLLREGSVLDDEFERRIRKALSTALTPRHVPDRIVAVSAIPRTLTGKKLEVPVRRLLLGQPPAKVVNRDALVNPEAIDWYIDFAKAYLKVDAARAG